MYFTFDIYNMIKNGSPHCPFCLINKNYIYYKKIILHSSEGNPFIFTIFINVLILFYLTLNLKKNKPLSIKLTLFQ